MKKRILSGVQPTGNLHIGNYLGAIKNWVKLQHEYDSFFCIVDLHAITVAQKPEELRRNILDMAKIYIASGIDPAKSPIFIQSQISEHAELMWILNTITQMGELFRMTQFKEKSQQQEKESFSMGIFNYPVLMAADILLYNTDVVPVGEDQVQHIELTRVLARRFNNRFGETFKVPEAKLCEDVKRIMGLDDPSKKMSKSAASEYNYIAFSDAPDMIRKKIKKSVTDSGSEIIYSDEKPAIKNLINIYSAFSGKNKDEIEQSYKGKGYGDFKNDLAEVVVSGLAPIQEKMKSLTDEEVLKILADGAEKVKLIAQAKIKEVKEKVGFIV